MKIEVTRPPADRQGPDIVDILLTTEPAALERGRQDIDRTSTNRLSERGTCPQLPAMATGSLLNVTTNRGAWRGKMTFYALTIDIGEDGREFTATTSVAIEREMI